MNDKNIEEAWNRLKKFWHDWVRKYGSEICWPMDKSQLSSVELMGLKRGDYKKAEDYLKYVVHPDDLDVIYRKMPLSMAGMAKFLYSMKGVEDIPNGGLMPMPPQPFFGSPINAELIVVFNNPGYEANFHLESHRERAIYDARQHVKNLSSIMECEGMHRVPWGSGQYGDSSGYYKRLYGAGIDVKQEGKAIYIPFLNERKDVMFEKKIFHCDLIPYQSFNTNSGYVKKIVDMNKKGIWLPSQKHLIDLLSQLILDQDRKVVVFRSKKKEWVESVFGEIEKRVGIKGVDEYIIQMTNSRSPYITLGSVLGSNWESRRSSLSVGERRLVDSYDRYCES